MELKFVEVDKMDYDYQNGLLEVYQQVSVPLLEWTIAGNDAYLTSYNAAAAARFHAMSTFRHRITASAFFKEKMALMSSMQHCIEHKSGISAPLSWPSLNGDKAHDYLVSMAYREPAQLLMTFEDTEKEAVSKTRQRARSKELFEFVRRSKHSLAVFDVDMCYLMASKGWLTDFHLDLPAILGESHYDVFPEIGPSWRIVQQVCLTGGIIQKEKELFLHHDGQMDWMRWEVHPWRHVGGQIGGILIQAERVDLQEDSVALFKYQFENAPDIILIINDQLCIETINRGLEQGQPASKLLGQEVRAVLPVESWDNCRDALLQCFETALPAEFDTALRFGKWMRLRLVPIQKIGIVTHVMLFATDITQQKQSELEVRLALQKAEQSEIRLVEAQKATKVGSWETNLKTLDVIWSLETYHIFEVNENNYQASHQSFLGFVHPDDKVLVDNAFSLSYSHQNYNTLEHRIVASNGKIKYVEERWKIVFDAKGQPVKAIGTCQDITKRKLIEQELILEKQRAEEAAFKLQLATSSAKLGIWDWQIDANELHWDARMFEIHGLSPKKHKLSYNLWINQLHPEDKTRVLADIATVLITTHNLDHNYRILKPSGELVYLETGAVVMCDLAGKPLRLIGLVKDVTNEKLVEQTIRDNEHKYRTLFETSDDAIILYTDRLWADCNKGAEALFDGNREQLIGQDHLRFSPRLQPSGLPSVAKANAIFDLVLTGKPQFFEWLHQRLSGELFHAEVRLNRLDLNGKPCIQAIIRDITERKLAEEQRILSALIVDSSNDAIISITLDGSITSWNIGAAKILGYSAEEVMGQPTFDLLCGSNGFGEEALIMGELREKRGIEHYETTRKRKDGVEIQVSLTVSPIFDEKGDVIGASKILRDITHQKEMEREKNKIMDDLMQRNRDLEQFSYIISHNLRSPVANIIGITDLLQEENHASPDQASLQDALASSAKALDVVIKDLNYILQSKKEIDEQKTYIDFGQVVAAIQLSIQHLIDQNKVVFELDFSAVAGISSINSYVYSILYNLISNSIKFKRAGVPPLISIHTEKLPNGVLLVCKDNGLGIDLDKKRSELFGLYKRFHLHTEGKGMGLFLVKTQIEALGGRIEVGSAVNEGTEMRLFFEQAQL